MDGFEATKVIRKDMDKEIPIIALTAAVLKEDKEKSIACGMNDFLKKPFNKNILKEKLLKYTNS